MTRAEDLWGEAGSLWASCAAELRRRLPESTWKSCFAPIEPLLADQARLVLAVPNTVIHDRIRARYLSLLRETLSAVAARPMDVAFEIRPDLLAATDADAARLEPQASLDPLFGAEAAPAPTLPFHDPPPREAAEAPDPPLNPVYTFDAFVIGASNRFAHAAALSVAETPAKSYNPLFIYGAAGLGKTHLLHAIGQYVLLHYPDKHVRYVTTETFLNEFIDAIRTNTTTAFKRRYRESDVLLVDDVQFIENKERFQEEFFHTFNSLHAADRQIVISSDRPPKSIQTLEDRLRSRFEWGLITDVQPPELETRLAILRKKLEGKPVVLPDEVLEYIATNITDNIRELEGALHRISAYASLNQEKIDLPLAERVLHELLTGHDRRITPKMILDATATMFGLTIDDLCGKSRSRPLVTARQIGMYVFRHLTDFSYPAIGREFGGRDHTTVMHAVEKISTLMGERRVIYDQVSDLMNRIKHGG